MAGESAPSGATMVDAQLTTVRVLKPFENFERIYQGKSAQIPIAFPGDRDPRAVSNQPGFDPNLMKGIPVPEGARVILWFPICFAPVPPASELFPFQFYSYRLIWRYQNLGSFRNPPTKSKRPPFHFPRQSPGAPDSSSGTALPRATLPAAWHVIGYEQAEPASGSGDLVVRIETITPRLDSLNQFVAPLLPNGEPGIIEQGVLDPAVSGGNGMPIFVPFWTDAEGDELIILANRSTITDTDDVWDFTTAGSDPDAPPLGDLAFSNIYGTGNGAHEPYRDIGIYMQTGTNP